MQLAGAGLAAAVSFLLTTPYALLDRRAFLDGMAFQRHHYASSHAGMDGDAARWYAGYLLTTETLLVVAAVAGTGLALAAQRWRPLLLLWTFPLVYGLFVAAQAVRNDRTILLLLPNLAVVGGLGAALLLERSARPARAGAAAAVAVALAVVVVGAQAARVAGSLGVGQETTWAESRRWIEDNVPAGSSLSIESYSPWVDPADYDVTATTYAAGASDLLGCDYIVVSERAFDRIVSQPDRFPAQAQAYRDLFAQTRTVARFEGDGPTIQVLRPVDQPAGVNSRCSRVRPRRMYVGT